MSDAGCATRTVTGPGGYPLGFGTWALGGTDWGPISAAAAKSVIRCAWDQGFRHFDSAESYGDGRAEQLLGQALRGEIRARRESLYLATKSVVREPPALVKHLERSLRRLGTTRIDLYYIHWPRRGISLLHAVEELDRQRERGRIGAIGLSNVSAREYREVSDRFSLDAVQAGYNILWRSPEKELLPFMKRGERQSCLVAYSPLAQGLLARAFSLATLPEEGDHRSRTPLFTPPVREAVLRFNNRYVELCRDCGLLPAAVALRWLLSPGRADAAVVGGRTADQVRMLAEGLASTAGREGTERYRILEREIEALYTGARPAIPDLPNLFGYIPRPVSEKRHP